MSNLNTPWTVEGDNEGWSVDFDDASTLGYASFHDRTGALLGFAVTTNIDDRDSEIREAIVVAVNSHDALVSAITSARAAFNVEYHADGSVLAVGYDSEALRPLVAALDAAIAISSALHSTEGERK